MASVGRESPNLALLVSAHDIHNHLSLNAVLCAVKSVIPSPPKIIGLQIMRQLTRHLPPDATSLPSQRKPRRTLSISFASQVGMINAIIWKIGMAESTF